MWTQFISVRRQVSGAHLNKFSTITVLRERETPVGARQLLTYLLHLASSSLQNFPTLHHSLFFHHSLFILFFLPIHLKILHPLPPLFTSSTRPSLHPLALHGALNKACYPLLQSSLHHHNSSTPLAQQQPRQTPVASQITLIRLSPEHHPHSNSFTLLSPDHRHQSADNKSGTFSLVSPGQHS